jgi:hypothetical protein
VHPQAAPVFKIRGDIEVTREQARGFLELSGAAGPENRCCHWQGASRSYGSRRVAKFRIGKQVHSVTRIAYLWFVGPIADNDSVLSCDRCDRTRFVCVNPTHLSLRTTSALRSNAQQQQQQQQQQQD